MKSEKKHKNIEAKLLLKIIGNRMPRKSEENEEHFKNYGNYYSDGNWDYHAYIRRIKDLVEKEQLNEHFQFTEIKRAEIIEEDGTEYFVKYRIRIQNLNILCHTHGVTFDSLGINECYPVDSTLSKDEYKGGIYIDFTNNHFSRDPIYNGNPYLNIGLSENARLNFFNNTFKEVDFYLNANYDNCFVHFAKNNFKNRHITVAGASEYLYPNGSGYASEGYRIGHDIQSKLFKSKRLSERINEIDFPGKNYKNVESELAKKIDNDESVNNSDILEYLIDQDKKISVRPEDLEYGKDKNTIISFRDNEINAIQIGGQKLFFFGKNVINKISTGHLSENIYYGPYNILDKERQFGIHHKALFIALKEDAIKRKDRSQELIFNREVLKCEQNLLRKERKTFKWFWDKSRKDRFILAFNSRSNNFGLSWTRPIAWMIGINLVFFSIFFSQISTFSFYKNDILHTIGMFFELLLPTNSISKVTGLEEINKIWEALNIIKNIFLTALIYQILNAFRRFKNT